jgi:hypothetical protein
MLLLTLSWKDATLKDKALLFSIERQSSKLLQRIVGRRITCVDVCILGYIVVVAIVWKVCDGFAAL